MTTELVQTQAAPLIILVLVSDASLRTSVYTELRKGVQFGIHAAQDLRSALTLLATHRPDIFIACEEFSEVEGSPLNKVVASLSSNTQVIFVNGSGHCRAALWVQ